MLTEHVAAPGVSAPPPVTPSPVQILEEVRPSWEDAHACLQARDFKHEQVIHLRLQTCYVLGIYVAPSLVVDTVNSENNMFSVGGHI